ncbi:uncharacterized protein EAF01_008099 [Botrytis porri]|uniref:uncharacterized protein n=1 Tax=Botrytis porri TaxID=87229 RepID=UPI00190151E3|nr:uncharacterized protein EAF01_008099 [Botrytis porri]KAF7898886.1 hypothetical protein EAF01_008099 [Botrytis porri]
MDSPNSPNFSRPLPPPSSPRRPPPPLSYLPGHNLPVSVPELSEELALRASLDGNLDDIHYPAKPIPDPQSSTKIPQIPRHMISSPSPNFPSHHLRTTMSSPQLRRSATSPDLSAPPVSPIPEEQEYTPNRNGAISRTDRYSRVLPAILPHPSTPPPPIPSSSSTNLFTSSRPSNLRHVTFAHETSDLSLTPLIPSQTSQDSSLPTETTKKSRFNLTLAHQKMHKAFSTLRTHTQTLSPKPSLILRKKSSSSALFGSGSGSSPLSASQASTDEPTRPKTAPSSSSSSSFSGFGNPFSGMPGVFMKDTKDKEKEKEKKDARAGKEMQIGAPTGMVKKTPEEIQQMLRDMGVRSEDLAFVSGSSASASSSAAAHLGSEVSPPPTPQNHNPHRPPPILSANQKGKLPALHAVPPAPNPHFTRPLRSSSLSVPQDLTTKPLGWYSIAPLDSISATLPKIRKENLLKNEEIEGYFEEVKRNFESLEDGKSERKRDNEEEETKRDIERLRREFVAKENENEEGEDGDGDDDDEDDDEEEPYIWGQYGKPNPDFVDGGWAQEETSSAGVGARWFVFNDVEKVLGGPKCPITHAVDGFEDEDTDVGEREGEVVGYTEGDEDGEILIGIEREEINGTLLSPIQEGFGEGEEEFDEDARQLSQEEILRREGLL